MVESDIVKGFRKDIEELEADLIEHEKRLNEAKNSENEENIRKIKTIIKETNKVISQKKELIMIMGDGEFNYHHDDVFDKILDQDGEKFQDEVIRLKYPLRGAGLAILLEIRELYYKWKEKD